MNNDLTPFEAAQLFESCRKSNAMMDSLKALIELRWAYDSNSSMSHWVTERIESTHRSRSEENHWSVY